MKKNKSTLVLFDIDGTLVHSDKKDSLSFAQSFEEVFQQPFPTIDWHQFPHVTDTTIFNTVFLRYFNRIASRQEHQNFINCYLDKLQQNRAAKPEDFREVPKAKHTFTRLMDETDLAVGIATGGWKAPARIKLNHISINLNGTVLSGGDEKETREDILNEAIGLCRQQHPSIERIVYIGDALWDVRTSRNLGVSFIGVRHKGDVEVLEDVGARHVIRDYEDYEGFKRLIREAEVPG